MIAGQPMHACFQLSTTRLRSTQAPRFLSLLVLCMPDLTSCSHENAIAMHFTSPHSSCKSHYICTPQNPLPPHTPKPPAVGAQLKLLTSKPHSHTAFGPRSVPFALGTADPPVKSHRSTQQSSAPDARTPRFVEDHSIVLTLAP